MDVTRNATKLLVIAAIAGMAVGTSGCKKLLKGKLMDGGTSTTGATTDPNATAQDLVDDQISDKLDEYIVCQNKTSSAIWNARKTYLNSFTNPKIGPTGRENSAYIAALPKDGASTCTTNVAKGKTMTPKLADLESAGDDYASAVASVDNVVGQLAPYFENKDFRDDKWAKGKTLHPTLMAAFETFRKADTALHNAIAGQKRPLDLRLLDRISREDGKKFGWNRLNTLIMARDLVDASDPPGEDDDIDLALYTNAEGEFEKALDGLTTYGDAHKADLNDQKYAKHWPTASMNYTQFVSSATEFKKSAKNLMRCMRDTAPANVKVGGKVDLDKMKIPCPDGKPLDVQGDVFHKFNAFIRQANTGRFP